MGGLVVDVTVGDGVFLEELGDALEDGCFHSDEKEMKIEKCKVKNSKLIVFTCAVRLSSFAIPGSRVSNL
ncbi:hypothetical protein KAX22_01690, partial [bacterium]|nr:hypothetical protein [bacterium]